MYVELLLTLYIIIIHVCFDSLVCGVVTIEILFVLRRFFLSVSYIPLNQYLS